MDPNFRIGPSAIYILPLAASSICKVQRFQLSNQSPALTYVSTVPTSLRETILIRLLSLKVPEVFDRVEGIPYLLIS